MADQETYGLRLEKKIDSLHIQMQDMNNAIIRLSERNESHQSAASINRRDIDTLQTDMNLAKGGLNFAKLIGSTALLSVIGFGSWVVTTQSNTQLRIAESNQKIAILESKLIRLDTDVATINAKKTEVPHEQ